MGDSKIDEESDVETSFLDGSFYRRLELAVPLCVIEHGEVPPGEE